MPTFPLRHKCAFGPSRYRPYTETWRQLSAVKGSGCQPPRLTCSRVEASHDAHQTVAATAAQRVSSRTAILGPDQRPRFRKFRLGPKREEFIAIRFLPPQHDSHEHGDLDNR
jgi:hypothetical protein